MSAGGSSSHLKPNSDLNLLAPRFKRAVEAAIADCNDPARPGGSLGAKVFEGFRSPELQALYFQRGRTIKPPPKPVTNAPTNEFSWHGYGLAVDVIHKTRFWEPEGGEAWFRQVAAEFAKHGCRWGGDWTSPDLPHFQWGKCRASPSDRARSLLRSGGIEAVWQAVGAADATPQPSVPHTPGKQVPDLAALLGKNINEICDNGFHDHRANHCAHFVAHALGLEFGYTCRAHVGGSSPGANLRVQEVFAECPRVGHWADADQTRVQLVFVIRKNAVSLASKSMANIPQKHVGIFHEGQVYHYSNTRDQVTRESVDSFLATFQRIYTGDQGLFFGEIPLSTLQLAVEPSGQAAATNGTFGFELRQSQRLWTARKVDEPADRSFLVGAEIVKPEKNFFGLFMPVNRYYGPVLDPDEHVEAIGQWAYLLDLTAACESGGRMNLINTYDRARFTFGFYQLAAHTPDDNLILFFRQALLLPEFKQLFPELELRGGRVFRVSSDGTATDLEKRTHDPASGEDQIQRFMAFLNPERKSIEEQEVLNAARLIWWANQDGECNRLQVRVAAQILGRKMQLYHRRYDLDGETDTVCALIADIHHQGRARTATVKAALAKPNKEAALLKIGASDFPGRIRTLADRVASLKAQGKLGAKRYSALANEFDELASGASKQKSSVAAPIASLFKRWWT